MKVNKPVTRTAVFLLCMTAIFASCEKKKNKEAACNVNSAAENVSGAALRVISTTPATTEIIAALGKADTLVAYDVYSAKVEGVPPDLPAFDMLNPDVETMIMCKPDIIINHSLNRGTGERFNVLEQLGVKIVYIPVSGSIEGIYEDIHFIAGVLSVEEEGEKIVKKMRAEIAAIKSAAQNIVHKKKLYFEIQPPPYIATMGYNTYLDDIITIAGAKNIFSDIDGVVFPSGEEIIKRDPDVIISNYTANPDAVLELYARNGFETITAIKNKEVYLIDADASSRPSNRIVYAIRDIANCVYPGYFTFTEQP